MPRNGLHVRPATADDLPAMVELGSGLREALLPGPDAGLRPGTPAARAALEQRLRNALGSPERRLVLAVADEQPVAMALFTVAPTNPLVDTPAVYLTHLVVDDRHRRRGAGRAIVAAAAAYADERGLEQLIVSARPTDRDTNRFFARLGFAPLTVRRAAPVAVVRRRLAADEPRFALVARRRPRRALMLQPLPPQPATHDVPTLEPDL